MFGNHLLPNIATSHPFLLPPPTHIPPAVAPHDRLQWAKRGRAHRAADAYPRRHVIVTHRRHVTVPNGLFDPHVTVSDGFFDQPPRHRPLSGLFDPHVTVPDTLSPNHRVTICPAVFSATTSPSHNGLFPPRHRSRDGLPATSPSRHGLFDRHVTAAAPPLVEGCGQMAYLY